MSVVLPTYNRARTLRRAISSVLSQSYSNLELIIVDDASKDATPELVAAIKDPRIRFERLAKNGGASAARNAGMRLAKGDYIAFQDSDDEWLADKLERQVRAAQATGEDSVTVFHPKILCGRDDRGHYGPGLICMIPQIPQREGGNYIPVIQETNVISTQTLFISREAFRRAGYFDTRLVNNEDWALGIELFYNSFVVFIDEPLVVSYLQGDSISMLRRRGARDQLRVVHRLMRKPDMPRTVSAAHIGRLGWSITKLGQAKRGRRLLCMALRMDTWNWRNWARFIVCQARILTGRGAWKGWEQGQG